jgi:hypothetical protein
MLFLASLAHRTPAQLARTQVPFNPVNQDSPVERFIGDFWNSATRNATRGGRQALRGAVAVLAALDWVESDVGLAPMAAPGAAVLAIKRFWAAYFQSAALKSIRLGGPFFTCATERLQAFCCCPKK